MSADPKTITLHEWNEAKKASCSIAVTKQGLTIQSRIGMKYTLQQLLMSFEGSIQTYFEVIQYLFQHVTSEQDAKALLTAVQQDPSFSAVMFSAQNLHGNEIMGLMGSVFENKALTSSSWFFAPSIQPCIQINRQLMKIFLSVPAIKEFLQHCFEKRLAELNMYLGLPDISLNGMHNVKEAISTLYQWEIRGKLEGADQYLQEMIAFCFKQKLEKLFTDCAAINRWSNMLGVLDIPKPKFQADGITLSDFAEWIETREKEFSNSIVKRHCLQELIIFYIRERCRENKISIERMLSFSQHISKEIGLCIVRDPEIQELLSLPKPVPIPIKNMEGEKILLEVETHFDEQLEEDASSSAEDVAGPSSLHQSTDIDVVAVSSSQPVVPDSTQEFKQDDEEKPAESAPDSPIIAAPVASVPSYPQPSVMVLQPVESAIESELKGILKDFGTNPKKDVWDFLTRQSRLSKFLSEHSVELTPQQYFDIFKKIIALDSIQWIEGIQNNIDEIVGIDLWIQQVEKSEEKEVDNKENEDDLGEKEKGIARVKEEKETLLRELQDALKTHAEMLSTRFFSKKQSIAKDIIDSTDYKRMMAVFFANITDPYNFSAYYRLQCLLAVKRIAVVTKKADSDLEQPSYSSNPHAFSSAGGSKSGPGYPPPAAGNKGLNL